MKIARPWSGCLDNGYPEISERSNHRPAVRVILAERNNVSGVDAKIADPLKQVDCLVQHVLDGYQRGVGFEIKTTSQSSIREVFCYFESGA